jgi:hypothetical protein
VKLCDLIKVQRELQSLARVQAIDQACSFRDDTRVAVALAPLLQVPLHWIHGQDIVRVLERQPALVQPD